MVFIYVLKLKNNKYYIGKTTNPKIRLDTHFDSNGSKWTQKYTPLNIQEIIPDCEDFDEDKYTLKYMNKYGIDNVRGGSFCELQLTNESKNMINKMINSSTDKCKLCGQKGHFSSNCNQKYQQESDNESEIDENYDNFKSDFLLSCKKIDEDKTKILIANEILNILNNNTYIDFGHLKITNIYGLCQKINKCNLDFSIINYRQGIKYENFIEGIIYILENDPQICDTCESEMEYCTCKKYTKNNTSTCYRCGRKGHFVDNCYASKHVKGYFL